MTSPSSDPTERIQNSSRDEAFESLAESLFDDLTRSAARICETPIAAMSLLEEGHHWFKSRGGVSAAETPRAIALCLKTIHRRDLFVVQEVESDQGPVGASSSQTAVRFFAGVPLITREGEAIGTLSAMDHAPRRLDEAQRQALRALGREASGQFDLLLRQEDPTGTQNQGAAASASAAHLLSAEIVSGSAEGIVVYDRGFRHTLWNRFMERLTGLRAEVVLGQDAFRLFPSLRESGVSALLERALAGETVTSDDMAYAVPGTAQLRWISTVYAPHHDQAGRVQGVIALMRDVTARRKTEETIRRTAPEFQHLIEQSLVGLYVIQDDRYRYVNPRLAAILGYTQAELLALGSVMTVVAEEDRPKVLDSIRKRIEGELQTVCYSFKAVKKNGEQIEVEVFGSAANFGGRAAVTGSLLDITDRKRTEAQIVEQAHNDPLTRLPNRVRFMERLNIELAQARRHKRSLSVIHLGLDGFKFINDNWGHAVGDSLLQSLALRLKRSLREVDTVARIGGDEFVILMPDVRQAGDMSGVAQKLLSVVGRPFQLDSRVLQVTTSVGVATYPDDGESAEALLRNADAAMYRAKDLGRNGFQLCTPELTAMAVERLGLQSGLRQAIDEGQFFLEYQPIVSLATGRIVSLEALVRWQHPQRGRVMPDAFIPVAEDTGLMPPLGEWVLRSACRQLTAWHKSGLSDLRVAVNVSARQFRERSLAHQVERALADANLESRHLEIEITESIAMEGAEIVVANLSLLRSMGIGVSIDDFGTGYSSMSYLKRYPVTSVKIDRSFVTDVASNAADAGIVRAIVEMAHGSKLDVIAEGVETKEQFLCLQQYGCDEMQGYWVSRPLGVAGVDDYLANELKLWTEGSGGDPD